MRNLSARPAGSRELRLPLPLCLGNMCKKRKAEAAAAATAAPPEEVPAKKKGKKDAAAGAKAPVTHGAAAAAAPPKAASGKAAAEKPVQTHANGAAKSSGSEIDDIFSKAKKAVKEEAAKLAAGGSDAQASYAWGLCRARRRGDGGDVWACARVC